MRGVIWINGEKVALEVTPGALLQEIIQLAISQMQDKRYSVDDFFCLTGSNDILDPKKNLIEQGVNLKNEPIYAVHKSKRSWFSKPNPYQ